MISASDKKWNKADVELKQDYNNLIKITPQTNVSKYFTITCWNSGTNKSVKRDCTFK